MYKCYFTSGISPRMDHISGTEVLRVSGRPPDSQKPLLGRNICNAIFQTVYEHE